MSKTEPSDPTSAALVEANRLETASDVEVSFEEAIALTIAEHKGGNLDNARVHYEQLLAFSPDEPVLLHYSGVLEHQLGNSEEGLLRIEKALDALPDDIHVLLNYGNVLFETGRLQDALVAYDKMLLEDPESIVAHCNKGALLRREGELESARSTLLRAVKLDPKHGESWHNLGAVYRMDREWEKATDCFEKALRFGGYQGSVSRATMQIIRIKQAMGLDEEALLLLRDWVKRDPNDEMARHLLAGATGVDIPERASDDVVVATFQAFAADFDSVLERLDYKAPELVGGRVQQLCAEPAANLVICDAGVGTGLVGEYLRPYAKRLVGVDLSVSMLSKARERKIYDELVEGELTEFLEQNDSLYDLITSVDTLCYIGELKGVFVAAAAALKSGGRLVFTVEKTKDDSKAAAGYGLANHGRYHHKPDYLSALLADRFTEVRIDEVALRRELSEHVAGLLVSARRQ